MWIRRERCIAIIVLENQSKLSKIVIIIFKKILSSLQLKGYIEGMPKVEFEKLHFLSVFKQFEAASLEEAIEIAKTDQAQDWQHSEDDVIHFFMKK